MEGDGEPSEASLPPRSSAAISDATLFRRCEAAVEQCRRDLKVSAAGARGVGRGVEGAGSLAQRLCAPLAKCGPWAPPFSPAALCCRAPHTEVPQSCP